jgi:ABC-type microcin C transport system permease subunit YejB
MLFIIALISGIFTIFSLKSALSSKLEKLKLNNATIFTLAVWNINLPLAIITICIFSILTIIYLIVDNED